MQDSWLQYQLDKHYRQESQIKAKKARCCRALRTINGKPGLYRTTLTRFGKALSTVGNSLQKRYSRRSEPPVPQQTYWPDAA